MISGEAPEGKGEKEDDQEAHWHNRTEVIITPIGEGLVSF